MDFHEINMKGKIWVERLATLPTWTSSDKGRMVYITSTGIYYKGEATGWGEIGRPLDAYTGYIRRPLFSYNTTNSITISPGRYHINGSTERFITWDSELTYTFTSLGASEYHYLYIDDSDVGSDNVLAATDLFNTTTAPTWSNSKLGYYNNNDRCILALRTNTTNGLREFYHSNDLIHWDSGLNIWNGYPRSTAWQNVTTTVPAFTDFVPILFYSVYQTKHHGSEIYYRPSITGNAIICGRTCYDKSGDNQCNQIDANNCGRIRIDENKQFAVASNVNGHAFTYIYQNGYYLPQGL